MTNPGEGSDPEFHPDAGRGRTGEREWRRMFVVSEGNEGECRARASRDKTGATSAATLAFGPNAPVLHQPVILTATLTSSDAKVPPSGQVTFMEGTTVLGTGTLVTVAGVTTASFTDSVFADSTVRKKI